MSNHSAFCYRKNCTKSSYKEPLFSQFDNLKFNSPNGFKPPIIDSLPNEVLNTSFTPTINKIQGDSFSEKNVTNLSFSMSYLIPEGLFGDSLSFLKEFALSKFMGNDGYSQAFFDSCKSKNVISESFFSIGLMVYNVLNENLNALPYNLLVSLISVLIPWDYFSIPISFPASLSLDISLLGAQSYSYGRAMQKGIQSFGVENSILSIQKAAFLSLAGMHGIYSTLSHGYHLFQGVNLFTELDEVQQKAVLKHHALHVISREKKCNAVVIDGLSSQWGKIIDDFADPVTKIFYENCNTQIFRGASDGDICDALKTAEERFNSPIDHLAFNGHATNHFMQLNKYYAFYGPHSRFGQNNDGALKCIDRYLKPEGHLSFFGCNTATGADSLTERVSKALPNRIVTGIKAYFFPFKTLNSFSNNDYSLRHFTSYNSNGEFVLGDSVVSFKNGKEINS